ncbi:MAG: efflux RND transporter periplasmic adaptor subunit [Planctomycetaceae bacterium]
MSAAESSHPTSDPLARLRIPRRDEPPRPSALKRLLKWGLGLVLLSGIGVGAFVLVRQQGWLAQSSEWLPEAIRSRPEVRVVKVVAEQGRTADALVVATGYLESRRQANIGARAAGRIEAVNVEEGSEVKSGQVLAVLEHRDVDAALAAMKATLARSIAELAELEIEIARTQKDFNRAEKLWKSRTTTEAQYDQARFARDAAVARRDSLNASVALAEARVKETEELRENMIVRAPFDGTVISKDAEVGESILPGGMGEASGRGSVVTIADLQHLEVDCDVKEDYISRVFQGGPAEVAVDAVPEFRYKGRVRKIIPMGDRARATIKVKVEIVNADQRLFPEMSATVYFLPQEEQEKEKQPSSDQQRRVFCPAGAIQSDGAGSFVWVLDNKSRAKRADIKIGEERDGRTEILEGLSGGERVIADPPESVDAGTLVKVRE